MPPKPQVFKSPDGKEFSTRAEWRDYMMATFYSYKDKKNLTEPLIKKPGEIDGQMFDIGDCENSTLVIMDNCEQVQIDQVKNCRIFIGACASSIFIRNCENCVFYTSCRQLRLREVQNSAFYIYSMSEVHIEESTSLQFAPFNGGYPEHSNHLRAANLDPLHNLWYDIFDHNDPGKSKKNWKLLPVDEYEEPWFPAGVPCELAVQLTAAGSVARADQGPGTAASTEQAFSIQQMMADAEAMKSPPLPPVIACAVPLAVAKTVSTSSGSKPSDPSGGFTSNAATSAAEQMVVESSGTSQASNLVFSENNLEVVAAIVAYANFTTAEDLLKVKAHHLSCLLSLNGPVGNINYPVDSNYFCLCCYLDCLRRLFLHSTHWRHTESRRHHSRLLTHSTVGNREDRGLHVWKFRMGCVLDFARQ